MVNDICSECGKRGMPRVDPVSKCNARCCQFCRVVELITWDDILKQVVYTLVGKI